MHGLIKPKRLPDFFPHFRRDGHWQVACWIVGSEIKNGKNDKTDCQEGRDGNQNSTDDEVNQ